MWSFKVRFFLFFFEPNWLTRHLWPYFQPDSCSQSFLDGSIVKTYCAINYSDHPLIVTQLRIDQGCNNSICKAEYTKQAKKLRFVLILLSQDNIPARGCVQLSMSGHFPLPFSVHTRIDGGISTYRSDVGED